VGAARHDRALGADSGGDRVAHGIEDLRVPAGDDELRERCGRQGVQRRICLPRRALVHCEPCTCEQLALELRRGLVRGVDAGTEEPQEVQRRERVASAVQLVAVGDDGLNLRIVGHNSKRSGLGDRQGAHRMRPQRRRVQRDDGPVGMPDEVGAVAQELGDERRLGLEVAARQRWAVSEPGPVGEAERPVVAERKLLAPRALGSDNAAVHEQHVRSRANPSHIEFRGGDVTHRIDRIRHLRVRAGRRRPAHRQARGHQFR